ncbi:MAG: SDR family NAD(P)-dependent oxidoreductase [Moorellales bacterium]
MRLRNKVAVITGAASGIGREVALLFAREGAQVVASDLNQEAGRLVVDEIGRAGGTAVFMEADVTQEEQVRSLMEQAFGRFSRLDVLVNSAGVAEAAPVGELEEQRWNYVVGTNLKGIYLCCKHALPFMKRSGGGSIVNLASIAAQVAIPGLAAYAASKGGVVMLTKSMALDYAKDNIRANAVCPAFIRTPLTLEGPMKDALDTIIPLHPLGRLGEPIEVAYACLFLASDEASFITGACLYVDGGYTVH